MEQHTPGPWEWKDDDHKEFGHYRLAPGILLAVVSDGTPWGDEIDRANARLIAAAPDLLEALKLLEAEMVLSGNAESRDYGWKPAIEKTRAAIAKAEGRTA